MGADGPIGFADVNGDGKADLYGWSGNGNIYVRLSNGDGTFGTAAATYWSNAKSTDGYIGFADVNGDGKADFYGWSANGNIYVRLSNGDGTFGTASPTYWSNAMGADGPIGFADVNGDGKADLYGWSGNGNISILASDKSNYDAISSIGNVQGPITTFTYKPLTDSSVYTKDSGSNTAVYPIQDIQAPIYVVSSATNSDGIGGTITTNYSYGGAKVDLNGRGFLGYRYMNTSIADNDSLIKSYYRQDYPYIGLPSSTEKRRLSNNTLLASQQNTYATQALGGTRQFPYVSQSVESSYELDGSLVSTATTTTNQYDAYGNVTQISVTSNDGYTKTTTNSYLNDTTNWLLGRLERSTVISTSP
jgi:hypothetical protein